MAAQAPKQTIQRVVYRVQYSKRERLWTVSERGNPVFHRWPTKDGAIQCGRFHATRDFNNGIRTQLVIHRKDGQIQSERTYGADPVRRKG
jgi:hypothetical protein